MTTVQTQANPMPRINDDAPDFEAKTTQGMIKLSDFKGRWVVLFSHPADFTPVCTTEFIEFAKRQGEFEKRNAQLIGLSIDSVFSHLAWVRNIEQNFNVNVKFPVIADLDMKVAQRYGLIHPNASETATVRAVFIIDDKSKVRAVIYYPMSCGRNMDEVLRVLDALQTADKHGVATPANWTVGQDVIIPPPQTQADAENRVKQSDLDVKDWYFAKKKL
jgi:peroxiredoxin 2/4